MNLTEPDDQPVLGVADELQRVAAYIRDRDDPRDERLELFMHSVVGAVRQLEIATAGALRLQNAPRDPRLGYTLREVSELAPVPYKRCLKAAQNDALRAHQGRFRGRWVVSREAVIAWISEGCPEYLRHPGGLSPHSKPYRQWMDRRRRL